MSVFDLVGKTEDNPIYQTLEAQNRDRQYGFLESIVQASVQLKSPYLTQSIVRALNFHAIAHLHVAPGRFRHAEVSVGEYLPPLAHQVEFHLGSLIHHVWESWDRMPPVVLGAYVLWSINNIHPFENGNGRTARAACHFVICTKTGNWLGGKPILPELLRLNRERYVQALKLADSGDLSDLIYLVQELLSLQLGNQPSQ